MPSDILWPTFALALLIFMVFVTMHAWRFVHFYRTKPSKQDLAQSDAALSYPTSASANFHALCQLPMLYFALVPLLMLTHQGDWLLQVVLAWSFVVLRFVQSFIHLCTKKWGASGAAMLISTIVLAAMWIAFFIGMLRAATPQIG